MYRERERERERDRRVSTLPVHQDHARHSNASAPLRLKSQPSCPTQVRATCGINESLPLTPPSGFRVYGFALRMKISPQMRVPLQVCAARDTDGAVGVRVQG